ncbi:MAG: hypothetical protein QXO12_03140 [Candidatus Pacearchaeota archaeon]
MNKKILAILLFVIIIVFIYLIWFTFFSTEAKLKKEFERQTKQILLARENYEKAMKEDVYGGKTPEETLKLFIEALKKEDIELASKYFMLETNTQSPDYLTRNKWFLFLNNIKEKGMLKIMAYDLEKHAKPLNKYDDELKYFSFGLFNDEGIVEVKIDMKFNQYSQVWKIESL